MISFAFFKRFFSSALLPHEVLPPHYNVDLISASNLQVPNLFATDEKQEIVEKMRQVDRQRDKSKQTDGTPNALFSLFVGEYFCIFGSFSVIFSTH